jgi:histidinol-phosphate aminotransferase
MSDDISRFWSAGVSELKAYVPGEQPTAPGWIKLNTNECPYPPSPRALARIGEAVNEQLRLYPDPKGGALRQCLADRFALSPAHVFLGNGSDEVLAHVFRGLLKHERPVLFPDVTYSFYPVYCGLFDIASEAIPLAPDFAVDLSGYARTNGGIVLANPNAPTGIALPLQAIRALLAGNPDSVVVVDEAYVDFGAQSAAVLIPEFPNLVVVQTLSKSRALAGLRVAFALAHPALVQGLERVKDSFNSYPLDRLALAGAQAAVEDEAYLRVVTGKLVHSRQWLTAELQRLGFDSLPSSANFVLTRHRVMDAKALLMALRERRILVRHFAQPRIANHLRISVGTQEECEQLVAALEQILLQGLDHPKEAQAA